jgi:hypothetical protein
VKPIDGEDMVMAGSKEWRQALGDMLKLMVDLQLRFKSGNSVEVERTYFTRKDWKVLQNYMEADEAMSTALGMENWNLRQERAGEWQPIETAPRNEFSDLILFGPDGVFAGQWWEGGWVNSMQEWVDLPPTHWRPLPPPPAADSGDGI